MNARPILVWWLAGAFLPSLASGTAVEPLRLAVPVYREVVTHVHRPTDWPPGVKRPAVLLIGGPGCRLADALAKEQRLVGVHFNPAENLPAEFRGWEERLGHAGQDAIALLLKHLLSLPDVDTNNVGLVTFSFGVVGGTGALARHPELAVKFLIDWEGPSGPQNLRWVPKDHKIVRNHPATDTQFWSERAAAEFIKKIRCRYLRVQSAADHVQVLGQNQHAIELLNNAAAGLCPWTRCNDNPPDIPYDAAHPEREQGKWFPGKAPRAELEKIILRYVAEMTADAPQPIRASNSTLAQVWNCMAGDAPQPIHVTFVIHFDPLPAPGGTVPRWAYEAERDNLAWLVGFLERVEKEKGKEFVPRLTLEMAGDHAEWYLEDEKGFDLLRRLHQKGIHSWGTHFHTNYQTENHLWVQARQSPDAAPRVTCDHIAAVDKLIGKLIGSNDPKVIRKVNRTITGHFLDMEMAAKKGFDTLTGGRNEAMNLFFDHDVYTPWRPAMGWPLAEDLSSRWVLIPQAPVPGRIGEHSPLPTGVSEEYTRGMRTQIWQDLSVAALKRKFLHLFLEPKSETGKVRVFGWHEHTNDLFPDDARGRQKKLRRELAELVEWLNTNFISQGRVRYSNCDEVRGEFLAWESAHPKQSSFHYPVKTRDWEKYPYHLKGVARELMYAHHEKEITPFNDKGVHVHKLLKTDGRNWSVSDGKVVCDGTTKDVYLLWSDKGAVTIDFTKIVAGSLRRVEGASGKESVVESAKLVVTAEPITVEQDRRDGGVPRTDAMPIQFRMNVNYFPDDDAARENCRLLRRYLDLFKQTGVKASFWFTGLAAEQVQRLDSELIRLINDAGMPVAHHGANRPPNPQPIHRVKGEDWARDIQAIFDYDLSQGSRALWDTYAELVRWAAQHPRLKVVTFEEILDQIADDRTKNVSREAVLKAAGIVAASLDAPPEYIDLGGDYLSLADAFQAFAFSLAAGDKLPDTLTVRDILGPTRYRVPAETVDIEVSAKTVVAAAKALDLAVEVPTAVSVEGRDVNPAVFLQLMARTLRAPGTVRVRGTINVLPRQVQRNMLADALTKLQFWTFKPERRKLENKIRRNP